MQVLSEQVWVGPRDSAFVISLQMMPILLVHRPHLEEGFSVLSDDTLRPEKQPTGAQVFPTRHPQYSVKGRCGPNHSFLH